MDFTLEELYYIQDLNNREYSEPDFEYQSEDYQELVIQTKLTLAKLILKATSEIED